MPVAHQHIKTVEDIHNDIQVKLKLSVTLGGRSSEGFIDYYLEDLSNHPNQITCFNHVNELYFEIYGEYRFSCYDSFRTLLNRNYKKSNQLKK